MRNEKTMKILHLISTLDIGGAEQSLFRLVTALDKGLFENLVISMTAPGIMGRRIEQHGIPVHALKMRKGMPEIRAVLKLRFWASLFRADVIQCWMYHANLLGLTLLKPSKTLWGIRCSDMDLSCYGSVYRLSVKAGARLSHLPSAIVANSHSGMRVHSELGFHPKKWEIIPNGFDTECFRPEGNSRERVRSELGIPRDAPVIGLVARLDPMKDHGTFFKAAKMLLLSDSRVHFVLAGKGVSLGNPSIRSLMDGIEPQSQIHLLEERHDIPEVLNAFDIATSSSLSEGLPNSIGEAMATAVPCVVTDAGDSSVLVGDTGFVVRKKSPDELHAAWQRLISAGPHYRTRMGEHARMRIIENYSLSSMTQKYGDLYRGFIPDKKS